MPTEEGLVPMGFQPLPHLAPELFYVFINFRHRTILGNQFNGSLFSDSRHAGDVIGIVPHQALDVHDLRRADLVPLLHSLGVVDLGLGNSPLGEDDIGLVPTSWRISLSPLTIQLKHPSSLARRAAVPTRSSASYPCKSTQGIPKAANTSLAICIWLRSSKGVGGRLALYSLYSWLRLVGPGRSKAATA